MRIKVGYTYHNNIMRKSILYILVFFSISVYSQQEPYFTLTQFNLSMINPAYVGSQGKDLFSLATRSQWSAVEGSPKSYAFTYNTVRSSNVGIGVSVISDKTFIERQTFTYIDFSYKLQVSLDTRLFLGLKAGANFYNADLTSLQNFNNLNDPSKVAMSKIKPNIGVGAYFQSKDLWISLSAPRLFEVSRADEEDVYAKDRVHIYAAFGSSFDIIPTLILKPSVMLRKVKGMPLATEFTAQFNYHEKYDLGLQIRDNSSLGIFGIISVSEKVDLGYAYETYLDSGLSNLNVNTHEVFIRIKLSKDEVEVEEDTEETEETVESSDSNSI